MYVIKVLENKEYDKLPYRRIKESLGCADPKTKTAYVRRVHWGNISKTVNLLTIQHELEELVAKTSPHEEDGIRYKSGKGIARIVAPIVGTILGGPLLGGWLSGVTGMGATMASAIGGAAGSALGSVASGGNITPLGVIGGGLGGAGMAPGIVASRGVQGGLIGQALSGMQSAVGITPGAVAANTGRLLTTAAATPPGFVPPIVSAGAGAISGPPNVGALLQAATRGGVTTATPNINTLLQTATRGGVTTATGALKLPTGTPEGVKLLKTAGATGLNIGQQLGFQQAVGESIKTIGASVDILNALDNPLVKLGLGSMAVSALPISPEPPSLGEVTAKWLTPETVTKAGEKARAIVDIKYTGDFMPSKETMSYINVIQGDIKKAYRRRADDMDKYGLAVNEQWMTSGERLEMLRRLGEDEQSELTRVEKELILNAQQQYAQQQFTYIMNELKADEQTKRDLLYGELSDIIWRYNIKQEDLMNFRKIAADAGIFSLAKGMGIV